MKAINREATSQDYGKTERGFIVLFTHPHWKHSTSPFHAKAGKTFKLPCTGCDNYTGDEAIKVMTKYVVRGFLVMAETETNGVTEQLTLKEMESLYSNNLTDSVKSS